MVNEMVSEMTNEMVDDMVSEKIKSTITSTINHHLQSTYLPFQEQMIEKLPLSKQHPIQPHLLSHVM